MLIDTHTHLYLEEFDGDGAGAVRRALEAGVSKMVFPNVGVSSIIPMKSLASEFPQVVSMAMGLHPTEIGADWKSDLDVVLAELASSSYCAVGEVGIDLYWDKSFETQQMEAFELQALRAVELGLPLIIHCRDGLDQTLEVLRGVPSVKAVFHSFGGSVEDVERIRRVGDFFFGINGIVTFKNCSVRNSLDEISLDRLLLETDSPYLAPVPHRGKRNESAFLVHTAHFVAAAMNIPFDMVAERTSANACGFFGING